VTPRLALRLTHVLGHLLKGLCICTFVFPWLGRAQRLARVARWSSELLGIFRVTVELAPGSCAAGQGLLVANHISWIDIFVIDALFPSRFVAKAEVRGWPLIGILCARADTIFVARTNGRALRQTVADMARALGDGERIVLFPEGTSAAQGGLLPFRANLFEAAVTARVAVQPLAIRYVDADGRLHRAVEYIGAKSLMESIVDMLSGEPVRAVLQVMPELPPLAQDRRDLARCAYEAVNDALAHQVEMAGPAVCSQFQS
jgi:1-acyl-sn-glycerol-3-phosphate acyltransferase